MSFKKKMLTFAAVSALTAATAVPAMALENEFHGMYKFNGYQTNFFNGDGNPTLADDAHSGWFAEQRARILYTAKANDNLKLVTHFELDSRFGSKVKGGNDGGNLDADSVSLEVKNVYLDANCPLTGANLKLGIQPWADAYSSLFLLADMSGAYASKKFDPLTVSLGWFRFDDNTAENTADVGQQTADLFVLDGKFAVNKDIKVGASYYGVFNDTGSLPAPRVPSWDQLHMIGVNADLNLGVASVKPFAAYQMGKDGDDNDINAYLLGATAKVKVGPGAINAAAMYLSGDDDGTGDNDDFKTIKASTTYFNAANMWLLVRNGGQTHTSTSVLVNDMTAAGRGTWGLFGGYEGTMDKVFYNANIGHMQTVEERDDEDNGIGTEINAQVGYKVYDNLSVSAAAAYLFLGDALDTDSTDDPYLFNAQVSYVF